MSEFLQAHAARIAWLTFGVVASVAWQLWQVVS